MEKPEVQKFETQEGERAYRALKKTHEEVIFGDETWPLGMQQSIEDKIGQILEKIERGEYRFIIGEDASGRIPTLIVKRVVDEICRQKGVSTPKTVFVAGSRYFSLGPPTLRLRQGERTKEERERDANKLLMVKDFVRNLQKNAQPQSRALVVTDKIMSGASLMPLSIALRENDIPFDILAVDVEGNDESVRFRSEELGGEILRDNTSTMFTPSFNYEMSGVAKDPHDLHARRFLDLEKESQITAYEIQKEGISAGHPDFVPIVKESMKNARERAKIAAENILVNFGYGSLEQK